MNLESQNNLLKAILRSQEALIEGESPEKTGDRLLQNLLDLTKSEYGFIAEVKEGSNGQQIVRALSISNIAWNDETKALYDLFKHGKQYLELFHNPENLVGEVLKTCKPVIANDPAHDKRAGGLPEGHPELSSFLGLPFFERGRLSGIIGIANTKGGYTKDMVEFLLPFQETCAILIKSANTGKELKIATNVFNSVIEGVIVTDTYGTITHINPAFTKITGYNEEETIGRKPSILRSNRHDKAFYKELWGTLLRTGEWYGKIWNRRKTGEIYPQRMNITATRDEKGKFTHFTSVFSDLSEQVETEEKLEFHAYYDPLTGLPNRLLFTDRLEEAVIRAMREGRKLAVIFLDIDNFKNINNSIGHITGDLIIKGSGMRLSEAMREGDTICRFSAGEFSILIDGAGDEHALVQVIDKLMKTMREPYLLKGSDLVITSSVGVSVFPNDGNNAEILIKNSETAMYHAKAAGKDCYRMFDPEMNKKVSSRLELENKMRKAIENGEFIVFYQPKTDVGTNRPVGAEALVRWKQEDGTLVSPGEFIPISEETGLIVPIGRSVLFSACKKAKSWLDKGYTDMTVSVNLSAKQLDRSDLVTTVAEALDESSLPPSQLYLEVTESAMMTNMDVAIGNLHRLKNLGVKISMDDFGTGYSSLSHLKKFPLDELKIDQSFVRTLPDDADDAAIAKAIVSIGNTLGLSITAEGVEETRQLVYLRSIGCKLIQGFLFSRPLPADEFDIYLDETRGDEANP